MEFSGLSQYDKDVINKIIPLFREEQDSLKLPMQIMNIIYTDHLEMLNKKIISHRQLGDITSRVMQLVLDFLNEYRFIMKDTVGSYKKTDHAELLVRTGSIDKLFNGPTTPGSIAA